MPNKTTRRRFLGQTAALGTAVWMGTETKLRAERASVERLTAACIGVGGKGSSDTGHMATHGADIIGMCDIDEATLTKKSREFPEAERFTDFREMLSALADKVDVVTVSTPDHNHAAAALMAMKMGKHVYCQKPLTWSIYEARRMREVAEEMGVVTQMGNQGTSEDGLRETVEIVRSGALGDVSEVHIWTNRPIWPQGVGRPAGEDPVPEGLHWDQWIGPAPMRPFKRGVYHSFNWRGWVDFGTGALGDMACHTANAAVMALYLWDPVAVTALQNPGIFENETFPASSKLKFEFPPREGFPACEVYWYDGGNMPSDEIMPTSLLPASYQRRIKRAEEEGKNRLSVMKSGSLIKGSNGMLFSPDDYGARYYLLPEGDYEGFELPEQTLPRITYKGDTDARHKAEFFSAIKGEGKTMSNFGYAGRLTETILVGNLALRAGEGERIEWDAKNLKSTNLSYVNQFVHREYRDGWSM